MLGLNGDLEGLSRDLVIQLIDVLDNAIKGRNLAVERPEDFWHILINLAEELLLRLHLPIHQDPNVNTMWGIALLSTAWVGCLPKAKLYSTLQERPELTDEQRRQIAGWIKQLQPTITRMFVIGNESASKLREKRGQENYTSWE